VNKELKKLTLLYAEDEDSTRVQYMRNFEFLFHKVYEAKDGLEAKELYQKYRPDIVVLDVNMPKLSGLEVAEFIRQNDFKTHIAIISSYSDYDKLLIAIELKLVTYMVKPVSREEFRKFFLKIKKELSFQDRDNIIVLDDGYLYNQTQQILTKNSQIIRLTKQELKFIDILIGQKNRVFSAIDIYAIIWEDDFDKEFSENSIKTIVKNIRKKLPADTILNIYGLGYRFNPKFL